MAEKQSKKGWALFGAGCGCLVLIILAAAGVYLYAGWLGYREAPKKVDVQNSTIQMQDPHQLSAAQEYTLFSRGYPEAFTILFYEEETVNGTIQTVRLETWDTIRKALD